MGLFGHFVSRLAFLFSFSLLYRLKYSLKVPLNPKQPNPIVSGMRTPVYSCYYMYSNVSDKNACRSIDNGLTTHSTILDIWSLARRSTE